MWNEKLTFAINFMDSYAIFCYVSSSGGSSRFFISFIYGSIVDGEREVLWAIIQHYSSSLIRVPWMLIGDFNVISCPIETNRVVDSIIPDIATFRDCIENVGIVDLPFSSPQFTLTKKQVEGC